MTIQEGELCAAAVKIGIHIVHEGAVARCSCQQKLEETALADWNRRMDMLVSFAV